MFEKFEKFGRLGALAALVAVAGCATQDAYDIRPEAGDGVPTAVEWQNVHDKEIAAATQPAELAACVKTPAAADALLAQVKPAYKTDPLVATKIAAVTQFVTGAKSASGRAVWRAALLKAAKGSADAYRTVFFLEQLRWCGLAEDVPAVRALADASEDAGVKSFAAILVRELGR